MKRVLLLNYEFPPLGGGASPVSFEIAKKLSETGEFDIDVVTMGFKDLPKYKKVNKNFRIHRVQCLRSKKEICHPHEQLTYLIFAFFKAACLIKESNYDICHTHFIIPTGVLAYVLKKIYGLQYIITSHGSDVPGYNPDRFIFLHKFTKPILKIIAKNAELITTPSKYLKNLIREKIGKFKIKVTPNGTKDFLDKKIKKENIICSSGRLLKRKGFHYLIKAFIKLDAKGWKLYIMGDGPYRDKLKQVSKDNKKIVFTGWLDNRKNKFKEILNKAKIFCLLSSHESQGIVFIEAMSAKCAIIASNVSACKETVKADVGFLVDRNDVGQVSKKLSKLIKNKKRLEKLMENSRERYKKHYEWNKIAYKYDQLLKQVIEKQKNRKIEK